jgi:large conductance mechanosensitive channel
MEGKSMWKEFKKFITGGNIFDMAIGIIVGMAFNPIVNSLVKDVIMPPIGMLLGKVDFTNIFIPLNGKIYESLAQAQAEGAPTINLGVFINTVINFLIIAFVVFIMIRQINKFKSKEEPKPAIPVPEVKECPYCFSKIPVKATRCPNCTSNLE